MSLFSEFAGAVDTNGDVDLEYVRGIRKKLVSNICEKGMPAEREDRELLLSILGDISKDALGKKRIQSNEKNTGTTANAALLVAEFLNRSRPVAAPIPVNFVPPVLGDELPVPKLIEGQTSTLVANETYYEFAARTGLIKDPNKQAEQEEIEDVDI